MSESAISRCPVELWIIIFQHVAHVPRISPVEDLVADVWEVSRELERIIIEDYERRSANARKDLLSLLLVCRSWVDLVYEAHLAHITMHGTCTDLRTLIGLLRQPRYGGNPGARKGSLVRTLEVGRADSTYVHNVSFVAETTRDMSSSWQLWMSDLLLLCTDLRNFIFNLEPTCRALYGGRALANILPHASATLASVSCRYRTGMLDMSVDDMNVLLQSRPHLMHLTWLLPGTHKKLTNPPPISNLRSLDLSSLVSGSRTWFGIFASMDLPNLQELRLKLFGHSSITSQRQKRVRGPLLDFFHAHGPRLRVLEVWAHLESGNVGFVLFDLCPNLREFNVIGRFMTITMPQTLHPTLNRVGICGITVFAENGNLDRAIELFTNLCACGPAIEVIQIYDNLTLDFASNWCYKIFRRRSAELIVRMKNVCPGLRLQDCLGEPVGDELLPAWQDLTNGVRIGTRFDYTH